MPCLNQNRHAPTWTPSIWGCFGWLCLVLFFSLPLCNKNKKQKTTNTHPPRFFNKIWNFLRASKAPFSSPSIWSYTGGFFSLFFPPPPPLWSKNEKHNKHPPSKIFLTTSGTFLTASKALFSSPSIWSYMGGFFSCCFFLLLCAVKTKQNYKHPPTHPPRFFNKIWNFLRVSKALFSTPSIWSFMGGFASCSIFFSSFVE